MELKYARKEETVTVICTGVGWWGRGAVAGWPTAKDLKRPDPTARGERGSRVSRRAVKRVSNKGGAGAVAVEYEGKLAGDTCSWIQECVQRATA